MTRRPAITILELSATTTAVAALLCTTVMSLSSVRNDGRNKKCLNNLARIANATASYSQDYEGYLVPVSSYGNINRALGEVEWGGKSGLGDRLVGNDNDQVYGAMWGTRFGRGPATRGLNKYVYGRTLANFQNNPGPDNQNLRADTQLDLDIFQCPSDRGFTGIHYWSFRVSGLSSFDHYGNSYATPTLWVVRVPNPPDCRVRSAGVFLHRATQVPNPANTLMYMENAGRFAWRANYGQDDNCGGDAGGVATNITPVIGWHNRPWIFNAAFVDGHAAPIEMNGHYKPQPPIGIYEGCEREPLECYIKRRCATIRGPGWQLDTFPTEPVRSRLSCGDPQGALFLNISG